jgi:hypothetical protein
MAKKRTHGREAGWKYRTVEKALWAVLVGQGQPSEAFRARIRHLRTIGVPELPTPGSGYKLSYSLVQTVEIGLALGLETLGAKPTVIAEIAQFAAEQAVSVAAGQDCYAVVMPIEGGVTAVIEHDRYNLAAHVDILHCAMIVNVAQAARDIDAALRREALDQ